jgi:hypothetical protein
MEIKLSMVVTDDSCKAYVLQVVALGDQYAIVKDGKQIFSDNSLPVVFKELSNLFAKLLAELTVKDELDQGYQYPPMDETDELERERQQEMEDELRFIQDYGDGPPGQEW